MKINYQHRALQYHDPLTGEYNEDINEDGNIYVNATYEVCGTCQGKGHHFRSDLDENNLMDSMHEDGDYESIECYYRGSFDETCNQCSGERVVLNPDLPKWAEELIFDWQRFENESRAISDAERRMGA